MVEGLPVLGSIQNWFLWKVCNIYFPTELTLCDLTSVQEIAASGSRAVRLISTFKMIFPSFLAWVTVSSDMLLTNQKKLVVEEVAIFEKALAFWKLMVRIGKILCAKVVRRIAVVGDFPALWFVFVIFPILG